MRAATTEIMENQGTLDLQISYNYRPERRDLLFDEQVEFIFRLEAALREHLPALEKELAQQKRQDSAGR